ncbi:peptidoglycan-binding protein [Terrabacter sp. 2RAF25]|uniref:L,D-transpeptidase family protein n=1 Tax=Terrabacter sp. 2RAF25 TaxID=3232998 RepID=UPI003F972FB3
MQAANSTVRSTGALRRALVLTGALALMAGTAACTPTSAPEAAATNVGQTVGSPLSTPSAPDETPASAPADTATQTAVATPSSTPSTEPTTEAPKPAPQPASKPAPELAPKPEPAPVVILRAGDSGSKVRSLQARLRQVGWFAGDVSDRYGQKTTEAVRGFQAKRGFDATGDLDERTWDKLVSMTRRPTTDELANVKPKPAEPKADTTASDLDERCMTGRVMCVSKTTRRLTWVVDGVPQYGFDVRFGSDELPTREGVFSVYKKKVDVISNLYHTPMPYSMFFSGGQAVHYSSNFARLGYAGASHGCVNVRNKPLLVQLYSEVRIGDKVVVHW